MIYSPDGFPTPENLGMMWQRHLRAEFAGRGDPRFRRLAADRRNGDTADPQAHRQAGHCDFNSHHHGDHWLGNQGYVEGFRQTTCRSMHTPKAKARIEGFEGNSWRTLMEKWTNQSTVGTMIVRPTGPSTRCRVLVQRHHAAGASLRRCPYPGDICVGSWKTASPTLATSPWTVASPTWTMANTSAPLAFL